MKLQWAFSFLEMLIVLFIIGLLAAASLPALKELNEHFQSKRLIKQLTSTIEFAQAEARARHANVILCQNNGNDQCSDEIKQDLLVFSDDRRDEQIHSATQILGKFHLSYSGSLKWRFYPRYRTSILFTHETNDNGIFWYCKDKAKKPSWHLILSKTGHISSPDQTDGDKFSRKETFIIC